MHNVLKYFFIAIGVVLIAFGLFNEPLLEFFSDDDKPKVKKKSPSTEREEFQEAEVIDPLNNTTSQSPNE